MTVRKVTARRKSKVKLNTATHPKACANNKSANRSALNANAPAPSGDIAGPLPSSPHRTLALKVSLNTAKENQAPISKQTLPITIKPSGGICGALAKIWLNVSI